MNKSYKIELRTDKDGVKNNGTMEKPVNFNEFCAKKECEEYIRWSFGYGKCESCKRVGESYNIDEYPDDCLFLDEIKAYERGENVL